MQTTAEQMLARSADSIIQNSNAVAVEEQRSLFTCCYLRRRKKCKRIKHSAELLDDVI